MPDLTEKNFEDTIEAALLAGGPDALPDGPAPTSDGLFISGGYRRRTTADYDKALCLDPEMVMEFILATQPQEWAKLKKIDKEATRERFLKRLASEIARQGTLTVLRKGISDKGSHFRLAYFRPSHGMNEALQTLHAANLFTVVRQLRYREQNHASLDLVLFLNGLPLFTAELKNPFTGQTVENAMYQYRHDRDPREPLFRFRRCLAHFAVDPDAVMMTTHLNGKATRFLPFNQGNQGGKGNPPSGTGFATAYLWERVWARDSVLNLVEQFIHELEVRDQHGRKTNERRLIFPRYHQLEAVRSLLADARAKGTGQRYLIQHSAGSGKTNSISWLAHQLTTLYNAADERVFDTIIIVSDRRVLDRQLQDIVSQFEQVDGLVQKIDQHSGQLRTALEQGKQIIITTLQKFPEVAKHTTDLVGKRFAIIIDEAHSSQSGEQIKHMHTVLAAQTLEEAEATDTDDGKTLEDAIAADMQARGKQPHLSTFAFTATPKPKTLELFGWQDAQGHYHPHSLYSMRQAIEEGFILDVLEHYTTYTAYWHLLKTVADDPRYDRGKASVLLKSFVELHRQVIDQKVEIIVEHFVSKVFGRINGKAKAMIVTRSRLHAVRYFQALKHALKQKNYPFKALVAFSGTVKDGSAEYTEAGLNGFSETQTAERFEQDEYRFLVVANKYQTGFDQPLLHTMYVDKKLGGVGAVQTLSRLNRTHPHKTETMVLDFANTADEIQAAFQPYYECTILSEGTDPNLLYEHQGRLEGARLYTTAEVDAFADIYVTTDPKKAAPKLHKALAPVVERYEQRSAQEQRDFKGWLRDYVRLYAFLSQVLPFVDTDLEKLYVFSRLLLTRLVSQLEELPLAVQRQIDLDTYRVQQTSSGKIKLRRGREPLPPMGSKGDNQPQAEAVEPLSSILHLLNERFGANWNGEAVASLERVEARLTESPALEATFQANPPEKVRLSFDQVFDEIIQEIVETNIKLYKQLNRDQEMAQALRDLLFERYMQTRREGAGEDGE
jgi:type I restriction enzyme R subunit